MHYCRSLISGLLQFSILFWVTAAVADDQAVLSITHANFIENKQQHYSVLAKVKVKFGQGVKVALHKGFKLTYVLDCRLFHPRKYWFDAEVASIQRPITVSYHALSRQYLFNQSGKQKTYSSLSDVEQAFAHLAAEPMFSKTILQPDKSYQAELTVRLDHKTLPNDLQSVVEDSADWKVSSQPYQWTPVLFEQ